MKISLPRTLKALALVLITSIGSFSVDAQTKGTRQEEDYYTTICTSQLVKAMNDLLEIRNTTVDFKTETYGKSDRVKLNSFGTYQYKEDQGHYKVVPFAKECTCTQTGLWSDTDEDAIVHYGIPTADDLSPTSGSLEKSFAEGPVTAANVRYKNSTDGFMVLWYSAMDNSTPYKLGQSHGLPQDRFLDQTYPESDNHLFEFYLYEAIENGIPVRKIKLDDIRFVSTSEISNAAYWATELPIGSTWNNDLPGNVKLKLYVAVKDGTGYQLKTAYLVTKHKGSDYGAYFKFKEAYDPNPIKILLPHKRYAKHFRKENKRILRPYVKYAGEDYLIQWFKDDSEIPFSSEREIDITKEFKKDERYGLYTVKVTSSINGMSKMRSIRVIDGEEPEYSVPKRTAEPESGPVLSETTHSETISIAPNPASDNVRITSKNNDVAGQKSTLRIFDIQGKLAKEITLDPGDHQNINVNELPNGSFLLQRIYEFGTVETGKMVVQH